MENKQLKNEILYVLRRNNGFGTVRKQLEADGLKFQEIPPEVSFDF